jgi:hypothetical protein
LIGSLTGIGEIARSVFGDGTLSSERRSAVPRAGPPRE